MRQQKLRLEDLAVESFDTSTSVGFKGTVKGHAEAEPGTIFSWCNTCDGFTCEYDRTCQGQFTCDYNETCKGELTCDPERCAGGGTAGTVLA
jgi:hypothetical protein